MFGNFSNLLIKSPKNIQNSLGGIAILLTVHNFKDEILKRLKSIGITGKIINYVPEVSVEDL